MSNVELNEAGRTLAERRLKYTLRIVFRDGTAREVQTDSVPDLAWDNDARAVFVRLVVPGGDDYKKYTVCREDLIQLMQLDLNV